MAPNNWAPKKLGRRDDALVLKSSIGIKHVGLTARCSLVARTWPADNASPVRYNRGVSTQTASSGRTPSPRS